MSLTIYDTDTPSPWRTPRGHGMTVPIAKTLAHLMVIDQAIQREWPLTREQAHAEIQDALQHLDDISIPAYLITDSHRTRINEWATKTNTAAADIAAKIWPNPDDPISEASTERLRELINDTWTLLAFTDQEITGINRADAGDLP